MLYLYQALSTSQLLMKRTGGLATPLLLRLQDKGMSRQIRRVLSTSLGGYRCLELPVTNMEG